MGTDISTDTDLDSILAEVGAFGLFQVINYLLICIPATLSATYQVTYMFSTNALEYRCKIPYCDEVKDNREIQYDQSWLKYAIPSANNKFDSCHHYALINRNESSVPIDAAYQCSPKMFNTSSIIECSEFVYASDEKNVQTEFNIHCLDSYKLALVGTIGNIARFIFLPFNGLLSDRFGRLTMVIVGLMCGCVFGLMKSFSINYPMYLTFEFLESLGTTTFAGTFVLAIEWANSNYRVLGSMIVSLAFPVGEIILGTIAMYIHDFRSLIRVLYTPGLLLIIYLWIVPESIRWLLVTGRVNRAIKILKRTAKVNRKELSEKSIEIIKLKYSKVSNTGTNSVDGRNMPKNASMIQSLRCISQSKCLCLRFLNCCYLWMVCCFCYYGLSLSALNIPGFNRYTSFILIVAFEIPGVLIAIPLLKRMRRRQLMSGLLFVTAASTIVTPWIPRDKSIIVLVSFMVAKASISCTFNAVYVFTAEQWPTNIRATVLNTCSMIGRIGSMVAPLTAVMATYNHSLPAILFGSTAIIGSILVLFCPETYSKKLPDTIEEATNL